VCCPLDILAQVVSACFTPPKPSKWATGQPGTCQGRNEAYFGCPSWPVRSMPGKTRLVRSHLLSTFPQELFIYRAMHP
jgi:hypothetical protein